MLAVALCLGLSWIPLIQGSMGARSVDPGLRDDRRPVWNIAHMVNGLDQVEDFLDRGANSLEFDVSFDSDGSAALVFHGVPCDCFRICTKSESFTTYLQHMRRLTTPGDPLFRKKLVLLFMDLKVGRLSPQARYNGGLDVSKKLIDVYWQRGRSKARAYILLSLPSIDYFMFIQGFQEGMRKEGFEEYADKIGLEFSGNEDLDATREVLQRLGIAKNIWQGDGITNCLPRNTRRLRDALTRRDSTGYRYIDKVYWWTVDRMSTMRAVLRMGVDGIITNYPDRLSLVLRESEFLEHLKLASIEDIPWEKYIFVKPMIMGRRGNATYEPMLPDEDELLYNS